MSPGHDQGVSRRDRPCGLAYGVYAGFAVLSFVFVRLLSTETKGTELEDMPEAIHPPAVVSPAGVVPGPVPVTTRAR